MSETAAPQMPPFYTRPVAIDSRRHAGHGLKPGTYAFARETVYVHLNAVEFAVASKTYPIVFTDSDEPAPVAILGLRQAQNLFVDAEGYWTPFTYIPAYVRRYPFIFAGDPQAKQLALCIDEASDWVVQDGGSALFADGKRTKLVEDALELCTSFHREATVTQAFCKTLKEKDLLVQRRADVTLNSGERSSLSGFLSIDEEKFNALPDDVVLDWRKRGLLAAIYAQLMSASNWQVLVNRTTASDQAKA